MRVCLVDDDVPVGNAMALGLRDAGFEVAVAPGAAAGFDMLLRTPFDALVTDMNMPGTDGAEFISQARSQFPDLAIIAISGEPSPGGRPLAEAARARGANAALVKPFRAITLVEVLQAAAQAKA
jgi:CheY-like chemotaxis protein